jgi:Fic-DOC domain mobile mystery protein B
MGLKIEYLPGQTPLDDDEMDDLRIPGITTREELDQHEQKNIEDAMQWSLSKKLNAETLLTEDFIREFHKRMYGDVWKWAGAFRKTDKSIGIDKLQIGVELKKLLDDCEYWINNKTDKPDEIAIRFKHRLVSIHCFSNGNGRHSRLMADLLISKVFGLPVFTWGSANLTKEEETRQIYLKALRTADGGDESLLLEFARS